MSRKPWVLGLVVALVVLAGGGLALRQLVSGPEEGFLTARGTELYLDGRPFRAAGSNSYWPAFAPAPVVDRIFDAAAENHFTVMRMWAFNDIGDPADPSTSVDPQNTSTYFQYWDGTGPARNEGENGLVRLDYAVWSAKQRGIRLVLPLVNNWGAFGGMDQYVRWAGLDDHGAFYTDPRIRRWYKDWVSQLLERVNTYTGVRYKDEPTIALWELANEPRCDGSPLYPSRDCSTETILAWVEEMAAHVKSIDRKHLVGLGDEGFFCREGAGHWTYDCSSGQDADALARVADLDVVGMHVYPDHWGTDADWSRQWILDHVALAEEVGKPVVIGEYGWRGVEPRNVVFHDWISAFEEAGGDLALHWWLQVRDDTSVPNDTDGFTVYCPSAVCTQVRYRSIGMATGRRDLPPVPENDTVLTSADGVTEADLLANDVSLYDSLDPASIDLDPGTPGAQQRLELPEGVVEVRDGVLRLTGRVDRTVRLAYLVADSQGWVSEQPATVKLLPPP